MVDSAEVAWLVSKRAAAVRSRDAEYLASRYAPGALTFGIAPPLGARADEANTGRVAPPLVRPARRPHRLRVHDLTVSVGGDLAFCQVSPCSGTPRTVDDGPLHLETTLGLRRANGVWLVEAERVRVTE